MTLPHGSGQVFTICVIAKGQEAEAAKEAGECSHPSSLVDAGNSCWLDHMTSAFLTSGADVVGDEALIESIVASSGKSISFDKLICTPDMNKVTSTNFDGMEVLFIPMSSEINILSYHPLTTFLPTSTPTGSS